jgi:probable HAF family extracellular repeat protein
MEPKNMPKFAVSNLFKHTFEPLPKILGSLIGVLGICSLPSEVVAAPSSYSVTTISGVSNAKSLNDNGQFTGYLPGTSGSGSAFIYSNGALTDLGSALGNPYSSRGWGINNSGEITGGYSYTTFNNSGVATGINSAFSYNGTVTNIASATAPANAEGFAINDQGWVTGNISSSGSSPSQAFLYDGNSIRTILLPGGGFSQGRAINNNGWVTGESGFASQNNIVHAYIYSGSSTIDLGVLPGTSSSWGESINSNGWVVGESDARAFLYNGNSMVDLSGLPNSFENGALSINNAGQVVGYSRIDSPYYAVLYEEGKAYNLNDLISSSLGIGLQQARAINNRGQILAYGYSKSDPRATTQWYLLSPQSVSVPEPSSAFAMLAFGVCGSLTALYRSNRKRGSVIS